MLLFKFNHRIIFFIGLSIILGDCRLLLKPRVPKNFSDSIEKIELSHNGLHRSYLIQYPKSSNKNKPLLLVFHGGAGTPEGMMALDNNELLNQSKEKDFAIAYLKGEGKSWNDGRITNSTKAHKNFHDDIGYVLEVLKDITRNYSIDENQIHAAGISNGGMFSLRIACEIPERFSSIIPITANLPEDLVETCPARYPTNLIIINGTDDPLVPYNGGEIKIFGRSHGTIISTEETIELFQKKWNCDLSKLNKTKLPKKDRTDSTNIELYSNSCGSKNLHLIKINKGGHTWPGGIQYLTERRVGKVSQEFHASKLIGKLIANKGRLKPDSFE